MVDYGKAKEVFEDYVSRFDMNNDKIKLRWVHTFGVVKCAYEIAVQEKWSKEEVELAKVIALLHDIGRFEQVQRYNSFDDSNMDHALLACEFLFKEKHIEEFIEDRQYDTLIEAAISNHNRLVINEFKDKRTRMHVKLIRDADKLDVFRVLKYDKIDAILDVTQDKLEHSPLSTCVYDTVMSSKLVDYQKRITPMDKWVSFIAFIFDLNYSGSYQYLDNHHYIDDVICRIKYHHPITHKKMKLINRHCHEFIRYHACIKKVI